MQISTKINSEADFSACPISEVIAQLEQLEIPLSKSLKDLYLPSKAHERRRIFLRNAFCFLIYYSTHEVLIGDLKWRTFAPLRWLSKMQLLVL